MRRRVLLTACLAAGMVAGGSVVFLALREQGRFDPLGSLAGGSGWGALVGGCSFLFADQWGEVRGRTVHPLKAAVGAAGMAAATSWLPFLSMLSGAAC